MNLLAKKLFYLCILLIRKFNDLSYMNHSFMFNGFVMSAIVFTCIKNIMIMTLHQAANLHARYRIKSRLLKRKCRSFLPLWNKFILLKSIDLTTKNIRQIRLTRDFLRNTNLKSSLMKLPFQSL